MQNETARKAETEAAPGKSSQGELPDNRQKAEAVADEEKQVMAPTEKWQPDPVVEHTARLLPEEADGGVNPPEEAAEKEARPEVSEEAETEPEKADALPERGEQEVERLRQQVTQLEKELATRQEQWERAGQEWRELLGCFPEVTPDAVPDAVWQQVRNGVPLAAAYALYERKQSLRDGNACACNQRNDRQSPGGLSGAGDGYFSPAQVRAMSRREVRENYDRIFASMRHWQ